MRYIVLIYLFLCFTPSFCQETMVQKETAIYKKYNSYKKEMYIDNLLKEKMPPILYKNYYKNVMLNNYKEELNQQWDTINKVQRLYLYTQKANDGYLEMNKEITDFMRSLPDSTKILYIQNQDTIQKFDQVLKLIDLKEENIRNLKYRKEKDTFVINIITDDKE